ncbi:hypothetical protein ACFYXD_35460 [Streptomyces platensis]|uniref:hypothetical protein n=1 Tax=Streptomyces platensis TaxID=58346 RepID=UPI0036AD76BB
MTEQTITSPNLSRSAQRLLIDTANKLSFRGLNLDTTVDASTIRVAIGMTAHRTYEISQLTNRHNEAARAFRRLETITDGRALQERRRPTRTNADNTRRALERLDPLSISCREAYELLDLAKQAAAEDVAAAHAALGDVTGLTTGQVIERMYTAAGVTRYWV